MIARIGPPRQTVVIAHRACPRDAPENSLQGIRMAASLGADYVEVDVRRTRDGVPVLMHDPLLRRTTDTWWPVWTVTSSRLRSARMRSGGEPIPLLADVLAQLPDGLGLAIDIKDATAAPAVLAEVRRRDALGRVLLWSQKGRAVRHLARAQPGVEVALLRDTHTPGADERLIRDAVRWGANAISIHEDALARPLLDRARQRGLRVYAWLQGEPAGYGDAGQRLDGVVTDWVAETRRLLAQASRRGPTPGPEA
jgi:glycerophosphoryl diester phosphodiesterase